MVTDWDVVLEKDVSHTVDSLKNKQLAPQAISRYH